MLKCPLVNDFIKTRLRHGCFSGEFLKTLPNNFSRKNSATQLFLK